MFSVAVAAALGQVVDERDAKILKEQRFNNGDGRAGAAFATENEILFREESDEGGNRLGQYSYIGDDGKTYTVKYSAGKDGFRILDGAHIPSGGKAFTFSCGYNCLVSNSQILFLKCISLRYIKSCFKKYI